MQNNPVLVFHPKIKKHYTQKIQLSYFGIQTLSLHLEVNLLRSQVSSAMGASSSSLSLAMVVDKPTLGSGTRGGGEAPSRRRGCFLSSALFWGRLTDKASEAVCLICTVRGHRISDCKSVVFTDGLLVKTKSKTTDSSNWPICSQSACPSTSTALKNADTTQMPPQKSTSAHSAS